MLPPLPDRYQDPTLDPIRAIQSSEAEQEIKLPEKYFVEKDVTEPFRILADVQYILMHFEISSEKLDPESLALLKSLEKHGTLDPEKIRWVSDLKFKLIEKKLDTFEKKLIEQEKQDDEIIRQAGTVPLEEPPIGSTHYDYARTTWVWWDGTKWAPGFRQHDPRQI